MADPVPASRWPFLSSEWIEAVQLIRADYPAPDDGVFLAVRVNVTVEEVPFSDGEIRGHIDTTGPTLMIAEGHLDHSDFGIYVPYDLALQLFVDRDLAQVMPAIMGGRVRLTGDSSKVLMLADWLSPPPPGSPAAATVKEIIGRIDAATER